MIGEIRDLETAEIAVQAALTGHLVFSTLHTNDAASGITRLIDMGVEPFLITSSVNAFLAQRLVRTICPELQGSLQAAPRRCCRSSASSPPAQERQALQGKGCDNCLQHRLFGPARHLRASSVSTEIRKMIMAHGEAYEIKEFAVKEGMKTLTQDGLEKAMEGITTVEEVLRVC